MPGCPGCVGTYDSCLVACRSLWWLQITSFAAIATSVPGRHRPEQCAYKPSVSHCQSPPIVNFVQPPYGSGVQSCEAAQSLCCNVLVVTSSKKVQSGQVISSTVLHEMPVSVCVCGCVAYLELKLVIQYEPFSSVYTQTGV
jgi:hypothetical protein